MSSNIINAINYGVNLVGIPYDYWLGDDNQRVAPMFAEDGPIVHKLDIASVNCAGLCNLMLRSVGKKLPYSTNTKSRGGTESYFDFYRNKSLEFNIDDLYPRGTLLLRDYRDLNDQGHVAVLIEGKGKESLVLQSHVEGKYFESHTPGVNTMYTLEESNKFFKDKNGKGCYYERVVLPENWLE